MIQIFLPSHRLDAKEREAWKVFAATATRSEVILHSRRLCVRRKGKMMIMMILALVAWVSSASTVIAFQPTLRSNNRGVPRTVHSKTSKHPVCSSNSEDDIIHVESEGVAESFESSSSSWDVADDWEAAAGSSWEDDEVIRPPAVQHNPVEKTTAKDSTRNNVSSNDKAKKPSSGWSEADNWEANWASENRPMDSQAVFHQDPLRRMALTMELASFEKPVRNPTEEEEWIDNAVDKIMLPDDLKDVLMGSGDKQQSDGEEFHTTTSNNDSINDGLRVEKFVDEMGTEIAMLVRCNESPEEMLIEQGRHVRQLSKAERYDVAQLVSYHHEMEEWQPTEFFQNAVHAIFREHAKLKTIDKKEAKKQDDKHESLWIMNERGVSSWTEKSTEETCTRFDPRVRKVLSTYGAFGKGFLVQDDLLRLYMETLIGKDLKRATSVDLSRRTTERAAVWRDLENHGFVPPAVEERARRLEEIELEHGFDSSTSSRHQAFMDECEIIDDSLDESWSEDSQGRWHRKGKSSHEHVEVVSAGNKKQGRGAEMTPTVPLRMKDGDFVYIDEESCIGCTQCALAAPSSFRMLESGRARAFKQRVAPDVGMAVAACPVSCMHYVGYERLTQLEKARDSPEGDGRKDHRHFGRNRQSGGWHQHIPLHVARRDSSENKKDSLYHFLRNKCYKSHACPQRGCYDCPMYASNPESNPHLQKRRRDAAHVRAQHFIATGEADAYRKEVEL